MRNRFILPVLTASILAASGLAYAQQELRPGAPMPTPFSANPQTAGALDKPAISNAGNSGVNRMRSLLDAISEGDYSQLPDETRRAIESGSKSAKVSADLSNAPASTIEFAQQQSDNWERAAKEAFVAALPPRDQARGASLFLGGGTLPGHEGKIYIFVSRAMPMALLRAYALEAMHMGATLVVKGIRKGDTVKEYLMESMNEYNSVEGQLLSGIEINPNLFDMFQVDVVPAVVWTNRVGLDDIGSGCPNLPEGTPTPQIQLEGPDDTLVTVNKPVCAPAHESSFYKITGTIALPYVFDRFEDAGLAKEALAPYREALAARAADVHDGTVRQDLGNQMVPVSSNVTLDRLPKHVLREWKRLLETENVQRSPFGPAFSKDDVDDPEYRAWLTERVNHGLGL